MWKRERAIQFICVPTRYAVLYLLCGRVRVCLYWNKQRDNVELKVEKIKNWRSEKCRSINVDIK